LDGLYEFDERGFRLARRGVESTRGDPGAVGVNNPESAAGADPGEVDSETRRAFSKAPRLKAIF